MRPGAARAAHRRRHKRARYRPRADAASARFGRGARRPDAALVGHGPLVRLLEPGEALEQRALARAVLPHERHDLARTGVEVDASRELELGRRHHMLTSPSDAGALRGGRTLDALDALGAFDACTEALGPLGARTGCIGCS